MLVRATEIVLEYKPLRFIDRSINPVLCAMTYIFERFLRMVLMRRSALPYLYSRNLVEPKGCQSSARPL